MQAVFSSPPDPPAWMYTVPAGALDRRVLDQPHYWVTADGQILELIQMSRDHLGNVLAMLRGMVVLLHLGAMVDVLFGDPAELTAELVTFQLTGSSIATVSPHAWLESTALVRSIQKLLDDWEVVDDDAWADCTDSGTADDPSRDDAPNLDS